MRTRLRHRAIPPSIEAPTASQYPSGFESCQRCCGAVAHGRPLEDILGLGRGENHETFATVAAAKPDRGGGVTAGFGLISLEISNVIY